MLSNTLGLFIGNANLGSSPYVFNYTTIPSRPTLGTNAVLTWSAPGNILNTTGGDTQDKIISGTGWVEFHAFSFVGKKK